MIEVEISVANKKHESFVYATWLHSFKYNSYFCKRIKTSTFFKSHHDVINNLLFDDKLNYGDLYKKIENYKLTSISEIRVPLSESVKDYKFKISYEPKELIYSENNKLATLTVFLTNARVDNFTDS